MEITAFLLFGWFVASILAAFGLGWLIRRGNMRSQSLSDVELDACQIARAAAPERDFQAIEIETGHRLLVDWKGNHVARVHRGRRVECDWPLALSERV